MWFTFLLSLVALISLLAMAKVVLDVKRKKSSGFVVKESVFFVLMVVLLVTADIQCTKEKKTEEQGEAEKVGQVMTPEETRQANLLSQLQDFLGVLVNADKPQLRYYLDQGQEYRRKKEFAAALDVFEQALELNLSDQERLPFFVLMGNCEAYLKEYTAAINYYYQAERICKETQDDSTLMLVYTDLALAYQLTDEPKGALVAYFDLLQLLKKLKDVPGQKNALANIGFIYQTVGQVDSASYYHQRSLDLPSDGTASVAEAAQMNNLALTYSSRGMPDSALVLFEKALSLFREAGDKREEASVLVNVGLIHQEKGDLAQAVQYYQNAFVIDSTIGTTMGQAGDLTNLGSAYEQGEDLSKAKQFYGRALSLFEQLSATKEADFVRQSLQRVEGRLKK